MSVADDGCSLGFCSGANGLSAHPQCFAIHLFSNCTWTCRGDETLLFILGSERASGGNDPAKLLHLNLYGVGRKDPCKKSRPTGKCTWLRSGAKGCPHHSVAEGCEFKSQVCQRASIWGAPYLYYTTQRVPESLHTKSPDEINTV